MFLVLNPRILCMCWGGGFKKKNAEVELLEILCSHSDVDERTLPSPAPADTAAEPCRHGGEPQAWTRR